MRGPRLGVPAAVLVLLLAPTPAGAATYYVAPTGSDSAAGSEAAPFASWARAQTMAAPGDTVYFRGGTYKYTGATSTCSSSSATVDAVDLTKSGTSGNPIRYWAYPGEKPRFDFSGITDTSKYSCRQVGVQVEADWLYLKGLELTGTLQLNNLNHESWCLYVRTGNNNIFELLDAHHNMGPGFFVQEGGNNTFLNCDSHENEDTLTSNGDGQSADGFGCHPTQTSNTGNVFIGCRAWWNSDDSWDFINAQAACTVRYSWAWYSGYKPDAIENGNPVPLSAGNGNGFKGGGYGDPQTNVPAGVVPQHVIEQNCAFYNKANGLYANHEIVNPFFYNNTSFNNGTDVNMLGLDGTTVTSVGLLRNNLAFSNNGKGLLANTNNGGPISDEFNSWDANLNVKVTEADFQSIAFTPPASCPAPYSAGGTVCVPPTDTTSFAGMASARNADGSLPVLPFLRLAATSALIDKGTSVGLPYAGAAPDLGCFETGLVYDPSDGGTSSVGLSSGGTTGGSSGTGAGDGGADTGATTSGGSSAGGSSSGGSNGTGSGSGSVSSGGSGSEGSGEAGAPDGETGGATGDKSGCGCESVGARHPPLRGAACVGLLLAALGVGRRRRMRARSIGVST
jgi:hypothetical protein